MITDTFETISRLWTNEFTRKVLIDADTGVLMVADDIEEKNRIQLNCATIMI